MEARCPGIGHTASGKDAGNEGIRRECKMFLVEHLRSNGTAKFSGVTDGDISLFIDFDCHGKRGGIVPVDNCIEEEFSQHLSLE